MIGSKISDVNSTIKQLTTGSTFTGQAEQCADFSGIMVSCKTNQDVVLYIDFSTDSVNWDSTLSYSVNASINEVHRLKVSKAFYRTRFYNSSSSDQTYMRLQTLLQVENGVLSSPINLHKRRVVTSSAKRLAQPDSEFPFKVPRSDGIL